MTSTTAYRYWNWDPSNDRDFIGLPVDTISAGAVEAEPVDAGGPLRRRRSPRISTCVTGFFAFNQALDSNPVVQAGAGVGGGALPAGAERRGGDAGPARRLRLRPVPEVPEHERSGVRSARMGRHRSPSHPPGPALQLRPEGRGLRPARLWRTADDEPGAHRAASSRSSRRRRTPPTSMTPTRPGS